MRINCLQPQSLMFPGLHPMAMMSTAGMGYSSRGPGLYGSGPAPYAFQGNSPAQQHATVPAADTQETTFLYIPNNSVGAIIGSKGSHIRNIIRFSGASVKIAPLEQDKPADQPTERKVTIVGSPESQWKVSRSDDAPFSFFSFSFLARQRFYRTLARARWCSRVRPRPSCLVTFFLPKTDVVTIAH